MGENVFVVSEGVREMLGGGIWCGQLMTIQDSRKPFVTRAKRLTIYYRIIMHVKTVGVVSKLAEQFLSSKNSVCIYFDATEKRRIKLTRTSDVLSV